MKRSLKWASLSLTLLVSCADSHDMLREELAAARATWRSQAVESYDVHQEWLCYCLPPTAWVAHVSGGQIESVTVPDIEELGGETPADTLIALAMERSFTVEQAFAIVDEWIGAAEQIDVTYHESLGYPTSVFIDIDLRIADEEIIRTMRDLQAVPAGQ
jgi:hypothetical protein